MRRTRLVLLAFMLLGLIARPFGAEASTDPLQEDQWGLSMVRADKAWSAATGEGVIIAIVDSGVDKDHPEFAGKLVKGASFVGCPEGKRPCDNWDDDVGHGTHVAGIAAAPLDGVGVVGVAPNARIMPVRVTQNDRGTTKDIADGIRYAVDNGADVINMSLGGQPVVRQVSDAFGFDTAIAKAMQYALDHGVLVVYSAGNESVPVCDEYSLFDGLGALCVGAVDKRKTKTWYSNIGMGVDVVAPGGLGGVVCDEREEILSTFSIAHAQNCSGRGSAYETMSGTSMAAPFVAGIAALLAENGITGLPAANRIKNTASDLGVPGVDAVYGSGLVDAVKALGPAAVKKTTTTTTSTTSTTTPAR